MTSQGIFSSIKQANLYWQPPTYSILLSAWRGLNNSIFFARLFSILCTCSIIYTSFLLSKRFVQKVHPIWISSVVAFNPYLIWAAVEIRLYAFAILLSALLLFFFFEGYVNEPFSLKPRWFYFFLSVITFYTHFFLVFVLIANGLALVSIRRWKAFRIYFISTGIAGMLFMPLFLLFLFRLPNRFEVYSDSVSLSSSFRFIVFSVTNFIVYIWRESSFLSRVLRIAFAFTLSIVCFLSLWMQKLLINQSWFTIWKLR
jgi:uncharacterized membrane protein